MLQVFVVKLYAPILLYPVVPSSNSSKSPPTYNILLLLSYNNVLTTLFNPFDKGDQVSVLISYLAILFASVVPPFTYWNWPPTNKKLFAISNV